MITPKSDIFQELKKTISRERKIIDEISSILNSNSNDKENTAILSHVKALKLNLKQESDKLPSLINPLNLVRTLDLGSNEKNVE